MDVLSVVYVQQFLEQQLVLLVNVEGASVRVLQPSLPQVVELLRRPVVDSRPRVFQLLRQMHLLLRLPTDQFG